MTQISGKWKHSNAVYTGGQYLNEELSGVVIYSASDSFGRGEYSFNSILLDTTSEPFIYYKNDGNTVCYYRLYAEDAVKDTLVDFGEQQQSVSQEFYEWFTSAFTKVNFLSGVWEQTRCSGNNISISQEPITGTVTYSGTEQESREFSFDSITLGTDNTSTEPYIYYHNNGSTVCEYSLANPSFCIGTIVDFGEQEQFVSDEFYNWFIQEFSSGVSSHYISGIWEQTAPYLGTTGIMQRINYKHGSSSLHYVLECGSYDTNSNTSWYVFYDDTGMTGYSAAHEVPGGLTLDFGSIEQPVREEFYSILTTAFTRIGDSELEVSDNSIDEAFTALANSVRSKASVTGTLSIIRMIELLNGLSSIYGNEESTYDSTNFESCMTKLANVIRLKNNTTDTLTLLKMPSAVSNIQITSTTTITFYLDDVAYTVSDGTTWQNWIDSGDAPAWLAIRESPNGMFGGILNQQEGRFVMTDPAEGPYSYDYFSRSSDTLVSNYHYYSYGATDLAKECPNCGQTYSGDTCPNCPTCWYCENIAVSSVELSAGENLYIYYCADHYPDYCTEHKTYGLASNSWYCPECHSDQGTGHTYEYYDGYGDGPTQGGTPPEFGCKICTVCRKIIEHTYEYQTDGSVVCSTCGEECTHTSGIGDDGICYICGLCAHSGGSNGEWFEYTNNQKITHYNCISCGNEFIGKTEACPHDTSSTYSYSTGVPDSGGDLAGLWHTTYTNCACGTILSRGMERCEAEDNSSNCKYCGADTSQYFMGVCAYCNYWPNTFCNTCGNYHCSNCSCP